MGLSGKHGNNLFSKPSDLKEGSYNGVGGNIEFPCTSVSEFMKKESHKKIDLLKIDIEGFEYGVIDDIFRNKIDISQIVLEFHGWMKGIPKAFDKIAKKKLKRLGYVVVFKSNNDYTFVKKELIID